MGRKKKEECNEIRDGLCNYNKVVEAPKGQPHWLRPVLS